MKRAQMLVLSDAMTSENILFFDVFMSTMKQYFGDVAFYVEEHDDYQVMNEDVPSVEYFETLVQNYITTNEAEAILKDKELKRLAKHVINSKIKRKADFELKAMDGGVWSEKDDKDGISWARDTNNYDDQRT